MFDVLRESLQYFFLLPIDMYHDVQFVNDVFDLPLQPPLGIDIKERNM